jgi:hypothetical protein
LKVAVLRACFATATLKIIQHFESAQRATAAEALWEKFCFDCVTIVTERPGSFDVGRQQHDNGHRFRFANAKGMAVEVKYAVALQRFQSAEQVALPFLRHTQTQQSSKCIFA